MAFLLPCLMSMSWSSGVVSSGFKSQIGQPYLNLVETYMIYIYWVHLWCHTCRPLDGQHDGRSLFRNFVGLPRNMDFQRLTRSILYTQTRMHSSTAYSGGSPPQETDPPGHVTNDACWE